MTFFLLSKFFVCLLAATVRSESGSSMDINTGEITTGEITTINDFQGTLNPSSAMMEYTTTSSSLPSQTVPISEDGISISPSLATQNLLIYSYDSQQVMTSILFSPSPVDSVVISPWPTDTLAYTDELFSFSHGAWESSTFTQVQRSSVISEIEVTPTSIPTESITNVEYTVSDSRGSTEVPVMDTNISAAEVVGIVFALTITVASLGLTFALLICFCYCCLQSKYEYSTGNEQRMTIHQWNITSGQYIMNRSNSVSTFRSGRSRDSIRSGGSSLFGSLGFMRHHSSSADRLSSAINYSIPDFYSTPV